MGRFFSNVQIKDNMGRMMLVNLFCDMMKKRGLVPCSEDEALKGVLKRKNDGIVPSDEQERQEAAEEYAFFTDPDVLAELDRRKAVNTEILRTYGIGKR
ncbi:MAG: hypothetical protein J6A19_04555 [Oscillospiraceae bacterium]|nr:hypothetical protein [Oscillospiraceae bacterium]